MSFEPIDVQREVVLKPNKWMGPMMDLEEYWKNLVIQSDPGELPKGLKRFLEDTCLLATEQSKHMDIKMYYVSWGGMVRMIVMPNNKVATLIKKE